MRGRPGTVAPIIQARSEAAPIIERAPLPIVEVRGSEHRVFYVNAAFCKLLGKSKADLIGNPFAEIVPGGGECAAILDQVYETGEAATHAHEHDSEPEHWLYAMWPALDANQSPVGAIIQLTKAPSVSLNPTAINEALLIAGLRQHELAEVGEKLNARLQQEIVERREVENELRASAERFRFLAESMPQKIFTAQANGEIDYFNRNGWNLPG
ncbi:MAG: PAS domain-containing protein [Chthoniobacterales bacterium]